MSGKVALMRGLALETVVAERTKEAMLRLNERVADVARELCPVESGRLRSTIYADEDGVGATAPYAMSVEVGTRKNKAQPFLRPAFDTEGRQALTELEDSL